MYNWTSKGNVQVDLTSFGDSTVPLNTHDVKRNVVRCIKLLATIHRSISKICAVKDAQ